MRIVITGAGGFVGRGLVEVLSADNEVVGIDTMPLPPGCRAVLGDLADPAILDAAFSEGCDAVVHLATVPGGAAEADPAAAARINLDASIALVAKAAASAERPRFVFASSIAVFGDALPAVVDDATPLAPRMLYGAHKVMIETWIANQSRRGAIDGLSLRLPGIVARPRGAAGLKSAFMSDVFHALGDDARFVSPVSAEATFWLMSRGRLVDNMVRAITMDTAATDSGRALTLPALRVRMRDLIDAIAHATNSGADAVVYAPDPAVEAAFGRYPALTTAAADALGFTHDGTVAALVARALTSIEEHL